TSQPLDFTVFAADTVLSVERRRGSTVPVTEATRPPQSGKKQSASMFDAEGPRLHKPSKHMHLRHQTVSKAPSTLFRRCCRAGGGEGDDELPGGWLLSPHGQEAVNAFNAGRLA